VDASTLPARDVVTAAMIEVVPAIDEWTAWQDYRRRHPDRRYARRQTRTFPPGTAAPRR
jgi:hypothetical protein